MFLRILDSLQLYFTNENFNLGFTKPKFEFLAKLKQNIGLLYSYSVHIKHSCRLTQSDSDQ